MAGDFPPTHKTIKRRSVNVFKLMGLMTAFVASLSIGSLMLDVAAASSKPSPSALHGSASKTLQHAAAAEPNWPASTSDLKAVQTINGDQHPSRYPKGVRLFVGVLSAAKGRTRRDAVRQTWGSDPRLERVVFVVGRPATRRLLHKLQEEALEHKDIILVGHVQEHFLNTLLIKPWRCSAPPMLTMARSHTS